MRLFIHFILLIFYGVAFAQKDSIQLPAVEGKVDILSTNTDKYAFYVTRNHEVFFEKKQLHFWDEVASELVKKERLPIFKPVKNIIIYADKDTPYNMIQRLRNEIGKVWFGFISYKVNDFDNEDTLSFYMIGTPLKYKKSIYAEDWIYGTEIIFTKEEKEKKENFKKRKEEMFPPVIAIWQDNFLQDFYAKKVEIVKRQLASLKYNVIKINSKNNYDFNGKYKSFNNQFKLKDSVASSDLLFVRSDYKISYGKYCTAMQKIQSYRNGDFDNIRVRSPFIIEIPEFFWYELKELNFNLNKKN